LDRRSLEAWLALRAARYRRPVPPSVAATAGARIGDARPLASDHHARANGAEGARRAAVSPCPSRHTRNWVFPCRFDWNATAVEVFERVRAAMDD